MAESDRPGGDADEPIGEIASLQEEVPAGFLARLRRRIERRSLTSQIVGFSWEFPKVLLAQLLDFVFSLFTPRQDGGGGSK